MGGYIEAAAAIYSAVQTKEDAHHQEQVAKSAAKRALTAAPVIPDVPNQAKRDRLQQKQDAAGISRNDTILAGSLIGGGNDPYTAKKTLLGA